MMRKYNEGCLETIEDMRGENLMDEGCRMHSQVFMECQTLHYQFGLVKREKVCKVSSLLILCGAGRHLNEIKCISR